MQLKPSAFVVTITKEDIELGNDTFTGNPLALALARAVKTEDVFVARGSSFALEMEPPYRTVYLPSEAIAWLQHYTSPQAARPFHFQASLEDPEAKALCLQNLFSERP